MNVCSIVQRNGCIDLQSILEVYFCIRNTHEDIVSTYKNKLYFYISDNWEKTYKRSVTKIVDFFLCTTIDLFIVKKNRTDNIFKLIITFWYIKYTLSLFNNFLISLLNSSISKIKTIFSFQTCFDNSNQKNLLQNWPRYKMSQFIIILHKRLQYIYLKNISLYLLERIIIQTKNERATREEKKNNRQKSFFFLFSRP